MTDTRSRPSPGVTAVGEPETERRLSFGAMGGTVNLWVAGPRVGAAVVDRDLERVSARIGSWARRLTRFREDSDLSAVNRVPGAATMHVRPTLGTVIERSVALTTRTEGLVDIGLLDERLGAELGTLDARQPGDWSIWGGGRHRSLIRHGNVRFDLDGVAKGWIADRALALLRSYPEAMVDADGDVALRLAGHSTWTLAVADPFDPTTDVVALRTPAGWPPTTFGVATSGTSVHRWGGPNGPTHHLIDPRTRQPARTNVVQATVVAETAMAAEALAKSAVIAGSDAGLELHERAGAWASVLLLDDGGVIASPGTRAWLA